MPTRTFGYTLLEMVVVIALLALATAMVAPASFRMIQSWRNADDVQRGSEPLGVIDNRLLHLFGKRDRGIDRNRVAGVNAGAVNVFHDAGNQNVFAVTNGVHFDFLPHQIFIDQRDVIGRCPRLPA